MPKRPALLTLALWLIPLAFLAYFFYQPLVAIFRVVFSERWESPPNQPTSNLRTIWETFGWTLTR